MKNFSPQPSHRKDAHFLEISSFLSALSLLYRHRPHLLNFSN
jgi:hypothetical protein